MDRRSALVQAALLLSCDLPAWRPRPAQPAKRPDAPNLAPYVPTPQEVVDRMLTARQGDQAGHGHRPRLRRRTHPDHRGQGLRRPGHRRGHRSAAHRRGQCQRPPRGGRAPGHLQARERDDDRRVGRHGGDHLPAVGLEPQAPADAHASPQARHPHRRAQLRLRRLGAREDRDLHRQRQDADARSTCGPPTGSCGRSRGVHANGGRHIATARVPSRAGTSPSATPGSP